MKFLLFLIPLIALICTTSANPSNPDPRSNPHGNARPLGRMGKRSSPDSNVPFRFKQTTRKEILERKASRSLSAKVKRQSPTLTYGFCMNQPPALGTGTPRTYSQYTYAYVPTSYGSISQIIFDYSPTFSDCLSACANDSANNKCQGIIYGATPIPDSCQFIRKSSSTSTATRRVTYANDANSLLVYFDVTCAVAREGGTIIGSNDARITCCNGAFTP